MPLVTDWCVDYVANCVYLVTPRAWRAAGFASTQPSARAPTQPLRSSLAQWAARPWPHLSPTP